MAIIDINSEAEVLPVSDIPADLKDDLKVIEDKVTKTYTLADALRDAHAAGIEQTTGTYVENENKACALGASWLMARKRGLF